MNASFFPARSLAVIFFIAAVLFAPYAGRAESDRREAERGDGEYISFPGDNAQIAIAFDPSGRSFVERSGSEVYLLRSGERVYLGDIDLKNPGGADVIVFDADFDGRPEFLLKFDSSDPNQYYYLVDDSGASLGEALFGDPEMEFSNPTFQAATRTLTLWDRSGGLASYQIYKFRKGAYVLEEETEPIYEASRMLLERRIEHLGGDKTRASVRYYGDLDNKPVRLRVISKAFLYEQADAEEPSRRSLERGGFVIVIDAGEGNAGHMLKVAQGRLSGWVPEEAFLVRTLRDCLLVASPGSKEPVAGNLSDGHIPKDTDLPVLALRKAKDGSAWLQVYFLEGDVSGWVSEADTDAVPLPRHP